MPHTAVAGRRCRYSSQYQRFKSIYIYSNPLPCRSLGAVQLGGVGWVGDAAVRSGGECHALVEVCGVRNYCCTKLPPTAVTCPTALSPRATHERSGGSQDINILLYSSYPAVIFIHMYSK